METFMASSVQPQHCKGNAKERANIELWEVPPDLVRKDWSSFSVSPPASTQQPTSITQQTLSSENSSFAALHYANLLYDPHLL